MNGRWSMRGPWATTGLLAMLAAGALLAPGCTGDSTGHARVYVDSDASVTPSAHIPGLQSWPPPGLACEPLQPCPPDPGGGNVYVTISGEASALSGYPFPPSDWATDTYFVDGWELLIEEYIVVVDHITLWSNPDHNPAKQGDLTGMSRVAHLDGPFVVDLHKGGLLTGAAEAPEQATPLGVISNQTDNGGAPFDPTTTYGFGFSTVPATASGYNVNLTSDEAADYARMVQNHYSVLYRGHLTWKGDQSSYGCTATGAGPSPDGGGYDYAKMPNAGMDVVFGFSTPTDYVNCQNGTSRALPIPGEDYPRGLQVSPSQSTIAQVTVHMDHPFWESFAENSPVHFDQIAAQYVGEQSPTARVEDMRGVPFYAFTDRTGTPLPWRNCAGSYYAPPGGGQMVFDALSVPVNPSAPCTGTLGADWTQDRCAGIRDYADYLRFSQSTQGHLNSQGLCFVDRHYPAPGGGS